MIKETYTHGDITRLDCDLQVILVVESNLKRSYGIFDLQYLSRLYDPLIKVPFGSVLTHDVLIKYINKTCFKFIEYVGSLKDFKANKVNYVKPKKSKAFNLRD